MDKLKEQLEGGNAVLQTIHASEGGRAFKLLRAREKRKEAVVRAKDEIEGETTRRKKLFEIEQKYTGSSAELLEEAFKQETVGLVTAADFREKRKKLHAAIAENERNAASAAAAANEELSRKKVCTKVRPAVLSFADDADDDENDDDFFVGINSKDTTFNPNKATAEACQPLPGNSGIGSPVDTAIGRKALGKDPSVFTEFLSDRDRDAARRSEREQLIKEYEEVEAHTKSELLEVTYSYWDGSGHRRAMRIHKGASIGEFLRECHKTLEREFAELRGVSVDNIMYIKEDLILPHSVTFYDLIKNKAKGKSGPLFHFDVHDDVRMLNDARVEKDESHAGKIVDRKWYERNKHIFPASRWELYDLNKTFSKYTIHGSKDHSSDVL
eukprot:Lankesteria_metandrocarpae@DN544_c0_g1_i1.p1